jgi:hypothetical protein
VRAALPPAVEPANEIQAIPAVAPQEAGVVVAVSAAPDEEGVPTPKGEAQQPRPAPVVEDEKTADGGAEPPEDEVTVVGDAEKVRRAALAAREGEAQPVPTLRAIPPPPPLVLEDIEAAPQQPAGSHCRSERCAKPGERAAACCCLCPGCAASTK